MKRRPKGLKYKIKQVNRTWFQKGLTPWNKGKKGIHFSPKTEFKKGQPSSRGMLGKKHTDEWKKNMSERVGGKNHWNWKGGITSKPYSLDWTESLRRTIRERDHYVCQLCNKPQGDRVHSIHHKDYDKLNCNPDNLITLCVGCNTRVNKNREQWTKYFQVRHVS